VALRDVLCAATTTNSGDKAVRNFMLKGKRMLDAELTVRYDAPSSLKANDVQYSWFVSLPLVDQVVKLQIVTPG
jgi:hypothetical protein